MLRMSITFGLALERAPLAEVGLQLARAREQASSHRSQRAEAGGQPVDGPIGVAVEELDQVLEGRS